MYLYNVTIIIEDSAAEEWLTWMKESHIPEVMATGKFASNRLLAVVDSPNEGKTFCVQYVAETLTDYQSYQDEFAPALQAKLQQKFENRFVAYRTLMEYID